MNKKLPDFIPGGELWREYGKTYQNYKMPFGKYKDRPLKNVPFSYLEWLEGENVNDNTIKKYVNIIRKKAGFRI